MTQYELELAAVHVAGFILSAIIFGGIFALVVAFSA
jgi:hypothetical protein